MDKQKTPVNSVPGIIFSIVLVLGITLWSGIVNFSSFLMGTSATLAAFLISLLYVGIWLAFSLRTKNRIFAIITIIWGGLTFTVAALGLFIYAFDLTAGILLPFVLILLPYFQGLTFVIPSLTVLYVIIIVISILWLSAGICSLRKLKK